MMFIVSSTMLLYIFLFIFSFFGFLRQSFFVQLWLSLNSFCRSVWTQTQRFHCSAGIKCMYHRHSIFFILFLKGKKNTRAILDLRDTLIFFLIRKIKTLFHCTQEFRISEETGCIFHLSHQWDLMSFPTPRMNVLFKSLLSSPGYRTLKSCFGNLLDHNESPTT